MAAPPSTFLVIGAGGHGRVVADLLRALGHDLRGFVDRDPSHIGTAIEPAGTRVVIAQDALVAEPLESLLAHGAEAIALGVGDNGARYRLVRALDAAPLPLLAHPTAWISRGASLGRGTTVLPRAVVHTAARAGCGCIVNSGAIIEHDCRLGDAVHVSPGAVLCGGVTVGDRTWIGAGSVIIEQIRIGDDCVIGAGAVVVRDVPDGTTVVGNPARPLPRSG